MAELYVRTTDKINTKDAKSDAQCYKRAFVVEIFEDDHKYGTGEINNPNHILIKCPGVDKEKLNAYLVPEPDKGIANVILQRRGFMFDLDTYLLNPAWRDNLTEQQVLSLKLTVPLKQNLDVIG